MVKKIIKVNFIETASDDFGNEDVEVFYLSINDKYINNLSYLYDIWDRMWNYGRSYDSYEEYIEENEEDKVVKDHFDDLKKLTLNGGWKFESFVKIINYIYSDAECEFVEYVTVFDFKWQG